MALYLGGSVDLKEILGCMQDGHFHVIERKLNNGEYTSYSVHSASIRESFAARMSDLANREGHDTLVFQREGRKIFWRTSGVMNGTQVKNVEVAFEKAPSLIRNASNNPFTREQNPQS